MPPLIDVHQSPITVTFQASVISKATIFQVFTLVLTIVSPLLVAYRTQGLWLKTNTYREQPRVLFKHQFIFLLGTADPDVYHYWSSFPALNSLEEAHLLIPQIQSREEDDNEDGKAERLILRAEFPLPPGQLIHMARVLLLLDYRLELHSRLQMETLVSLKEESVLPGSELKVSGDVRISQRVPLRHKGIDHRFNFPVIDVSGREADSLRLQSILSDFFRRNVTTKLTSRHSFWIPSSRTPSFTFDLNFNFPMDTIEYQPGFWELIKWGWIQYYSILAVFLFVFGKITEFAFRNRLLPTIVQWKWRTLLT